MSHPPEREGGTNGTMDSAEIGHHCALDTTGRALSERVWERLLWTIQRLECGIWTASASPCTTRIGPGEASTSSQAAITRGDFQLSGFQN